MQVIATKVLLTYPNHSKSIANILENPSMSLQQNQYPATKIGCASNRWYATLATILAAIAEIERLLLPRPLAASPMDGLGPLDVIKSLQQFLYI